MNFETNNRTGPYPVGTEVIITWSDDLADVGLIMWAESLELCSGEFYPHARDNLIHQMFSIASHHKGYFPICWTRPNKDPDKEELTEESLKIVTDYLETV